MEKKELQSELAKRGIFSEIRECPGDTLFNHEQVTVYVRFTYRDIRCEVSTWHRGGKFANLVQRIRREIKLQESYVDDLYTYGVDEKGMVDYNGVCNA